MPRNASHTRERILSAAGKLFYGRGIRNVSMDDVAARAGVTKRTLYYHFRSKDDLIAAYLQARDQPTLALVAQWMDVTEGPLERQIAEVFARIGQLARNPKWRGCGFLRTAAELASMPGHPAVKAGAAHKKKLEAEFAARIAAAGFDNAATRARQIMVLFDGSFSAMLVHRDGAYAEAAGRATAAILRA
jgi:AcrR family transcriptional regulator